MVSRRIEGSGCQDRSTDSTSIPATYLEISVND
jgi:hypothetical protein